MNALLDPAGDFPALPALQVRWRTVYYEPLPASGERYAVAVVAVVDGARAGARLALSDRQAACLLGEYGESLQGHARFAIEAFTAWWAPGRGIEDWQPPLERMTVGPARETRADTDDEALMAAVSGCAATLGRVREVEALPDPASPLDATSQFEAQVRRQLLARAPGLKENLGRRFGSAAAREANQVDYLGTRYGASFSAFDPHRFKPSMHRAQWKLWQLARVRDGDDGGLVVFLVAYVAGIATGVMAFAAFVLERAA